VLVVLVNRQPCAKTHTDALSHKQRRGSPIPEDNAAGSKRPKTREETREDLIASASDLARLAASYEIDERWKEAEETRLEVLRLHRRTLGDEHCEALANTVALRP
jgi:hypothetical protein